MSAMGEVCVLRLGHRRGRDQRITTHVFLTARACGASRGVLCGDRDDSVVDGVARVSSLWGGSFSVAYEENWKRFVAQRRKEGWKVAHLTMYGEDFEAGAERLARGAGDCLVIVGAGKVPREAYELSDVNLSVTTQPHSEVAAVALFLDRYFGGRELKLDFCGKLRVVPNSRGKTVVGRRQTKA